MFSANLTTQPKQVRMFVSVLFNRRLRRNLRACVMPSVTSPIHPSIVELQCPFSLFSMALRQRLIALLDLFQVFRNGRRHRVVTRPANRKEDRKQQHVVEWLAGSPVDDLSG